MSDDILIKYNDPVMTGISVLEKLPPTIVLPSTGASSLIEFASSNVTSRYVGQADHTKIVCVTLGWIRSTGISSIAINGSAMTLVSAPIVTSGTTTIGSAIAYQAFSGGPTATIEITMSSPTGVANSQVYIVTCGSSILDTLSTSSSGTATISGSIDVEIQGGVVAASVTETSSNSVTWTTLIEQNDRAAAGTLFRYSDAYLSGSSITAASTITVSADTGVSDYKSLTSISFSYTG